MIYKGVDDKLNYDVLVAKGIDKQIDIEIDINKQRSNKDAKADSHYDLSYIRNKSKTNE